MKRPHAHKTSPPRRAGMGHPKKRKAGSSPPSHNVFTLAACRGTRRVGFGMTPKAKAAELRDGREALRYKKIPPFTKAVKVRLQDSGGVHRTPETGDGAPEKATAKAHRLKPVPRKAASSSGCPPMQPESARRTATPKKQQQIPHAVRTRCEQVRNDIMHDESFV